MQLSWLGLIQRILSEEFGPSGGRVALVVLLIIVAVFASLPFVILGTALKVRRLGASLGVTNQSLERLMAQINETTTLVKESSSLVRERLAAVPPPVRFGPDPAQRPEGAPGPEAADPASADGQGMYNYCPSCKSIQYIKFLRCQTCGFHVLPSK